MVNEQIAKIAMNNPTLLYVSLVVCFIVSLRHSWQYFSHITMRNFSGYLHYYNKNLMYNFHGFAS